MIAAMQEAREIINRSDHVANDMADLLAGRLRSARIRGHILAKLKQELRNFDMRTRTWKDKK
jgi:hypothetical protein